LRELDAKNRGKVQNARATSGKEQGNDDLVMTFMIGLYWSIQFMTGRSNPSARDINL